MGAIKTILLTGATGYLGSNIAKRLVAAGYNLIILKRKRSSLSKIKDIQSTIKLVDIEDVNYDELFTNWQIDAIVHTAASYGRKGESMVEVYNANVVFPLQLLQSGIQHKVKYFFNSNTTLPPQLNIYSLTKSHFGDILKMNAAHIHVVDLALQYFYGPEDDESKFVTFIMSKLKSGDKYINLSAGTQIRDFIYIDDVIDAYLLLLQKADSLLEYQFVPLGTGKGITLKSLTEKIKLMLKNETTTLNFGALPMREGEIMEAVADISFLNNLGWNPRFNIDEGLKETIK